MVGIGSKVAGASGVSSRVVPPTLEVMTTTLGVSEVGASYSAKLFASGGRTPHVWNLATGALAPGLVLSSSGTITGIPESSGTFAFVVTVTDDSGATGSVSLMQSTAPAVSITTKSLSQGAVATSYAADLSAAGGVAPYVWSIASGRLPGGMLLTQTGTLSGRPGTEGVTPVDVKVKDAAGGVATKTLNFTALPAPQLLGFLTPHGDVFVLSSSGAETSEVYPSPINAVGIAFAASGSGFWSVDSTGAVQCFDGAPDDGSVGASHLQGAIAGIAASPDANGYWIVTTKGHVYGFGDVPRFSSLRPGQISGRVVGIAAASNGRGYWLLSSKGQVFGFGQVRTFGPVPIQSSAGAPVGIAALSSAQGYWVVTAKGFVYSFGAAENYPQLSSGTITTRVAGIAASPQGNGYWVVTRSGRVYSYGSAFETSGASGASVVESVVATT